MHDSVKIIGISANLVYIGLFASSIPTFWNIVRNKTTAGYSGVPYVFLLLHSLVWLFYGSPYVNKETLLITVNATGTVMEAVYVILFIYYAKGLRTRVRMIALTTILLIMFAILVTLNITLVHRRNRRTNIVGSIATVVGVQAFTAPLLIMYKVIRTRSTEYMPLPFCLLQLATGILWTLFGVLSHDVFIVIPSAVGIGVAGLQLLCWIFFFLLHKFFDVPDPKAQAADKAIADKAAADKGAGAGDPELALPESKPESSKAEPEPSSSANEPSEATPPEGADIESGKASSANEPSEATPPEGTDIESGKATKPRFSTRNPEDDPVSMYSKS